MKHWWIVIFFILLVAVVGGAGYLGSRSAQAEATPVVQAPPVVAVTRGDVAQTVTAPGKLVGIHQVTLSSDVNGRLAEINVRPGDIVETGEVLAQLTTHNLENALIKAKLDLRQAELALEELQKPVDEADIRAAEHNVDQAAAALHVSQAQRDHTLAGNLHLKDLPDARTSVKDKQEWYDSRLKLHQQEGLDYWFVDQAKQDLEEAQKHLQRLEAQAALEQRNAENEVTKAYQTHQEAQDSLAKLQEGQDSLKLEAAHLKIEIAQTTLDTAQHDLEAAAITAPFDGVILEVKAGAGETVVAGDALIVLSDPRAVEIEANVIEEDFPLVAVGQGAEVFFDAQPELVPVGTVARIVPQRLPGDRPLYPVIIAMNEELPATLAPGMTVDASIVLDARENVLRLPRAIVHARSDGTAVVNVWDGHTLAERDIKVGLRGDVFVEILEGLAEGEEVVAE
ncbi:MAG: efflux RND transporter periplasmic adaptor subunit [Anaerolineae bacterium]|nr:efflux RND transporter periplasmic adaptor subunit [Anaerolineae bacterium]